MRALIYHRRGYDDRHRRRDEHRGKRGGMMTCMRRLVLVAGFACVACSSGSSTNASAVARVKTTATEAWPDRGPEPPPLTLQEVADACAIWLTCVMAPDAGTPRESWANLYYLCGLHEGSEERAIPGVVGARWSWWARAAIAAHGDCTAVAALQTQVPSGFQCEEVGCSISTGPASTTTCAGDVATITEGSMHYVRDCSHAFALCEETSLTGCHDRRAVACDATLADRCDGDVKLGCDHTGRVSFHDCSRTRGRCIETAGGAACFHDNPAAPCGQADTTCTDGRILHGCTVGGFVDVDCTALGFTGCATAHCT